MGNGNKSILLLQANTIFYDNDDEENDDNLKENKMILTEKSLNMKFNCIVEFKDVYQEELRK